jgi:hypothetical protein
LQALIPETADWQRDRSVLYENIGDVLVAQRRLPEALQFGGDGADAPRRRSAAGRRSWGQLARAFQALLLIRQGDFGSGLGLLRVDWDNFGARPGWIALMFLNELAAGFGSAGQIAEGLAAAEQAIARAERTEVRWAFPESLRIKGELLLLQGATGAENAAEDHFRQALDWARRQGALSLELRAATSLARLRHDRGCSAEAAAVLQPVYDRFSEGFGTADLKDAKALLDSLP